MRVDDKTRQAEILEAGFLERGFQLAHFILQDKPAAIDVLTNALQKLNSQCRREKRRFYWRYKNPTQAIRRITRKDVDALQWLIMFESEVYERQQEQLRDPSMRDMIVRYVKHLVRITTSMSSFYVAVGLNRLLYGYATQEAQAAYELVTHRFLGADQYRRAKGMLTTLVTERFRGLLETTRGRHGELRFSTLKNQDPWIGLVNECLSKLTPWSTDTLCSGFQPVAKKSDRLQTQAIDFADSKSDADAVEMNRCHLLIEPFCRQKLFAALGFPFPDTKLALPRFATYNETDADDNGADSKRASGLSSEDKKRIAERLTGADALRQKMHPHFVIVVIDGIKRSKLDLTPLHELRIELEEGVKLIEIIGLGKTGEVLLGTHIISYVNGSFGFSKVFLPLASGQLELIISPLATVLGTVRATLTVTFTTRSQLTRRVMAPNWRLVREYILAPLAAAALTWAVVSTIYTHKIKVLQAPSQKPATTTSGKAGRDEVLKSYVLSGDEQRNRNTEAPEIPKIPLRSQDTVLRLELPIPGQGAVTLYRVVLRPFSSHDDLLVVNGVRASKTDAGSAVTMIVPADLLEPGVYYTVRLYSTSANGQLQEINRFTFQAMQSHSIQ
jgi:hypothetical protein